MTNNSSVGATVPDNSWSAHLRGTLALGLPLIGTQMAQMGINFLDTMMLGWLGAETLAASVLATTLFFLVLVVGFGLAQAVLPLTSQAAGQGDERALRRSVRMGFWVVVAYSVVTMPLLWNTEYFLLAIGQRPDLAAHAQEYVRIVQWSLFPVLILSVLRSYLSSIDRIQIVMWVTIAAVGVNGVLNYAFIFGNFGAPRMEIGGAALASLITNIMSVAAVIVYCHFIPEIRRHEIFVRFWRADWGAFFEVFRLGLPISLTILAEVGLFSAASIMMGWVGVIPLAAHGIALQVTSIAFMIPLSFSQAGTVRLGRAVGRGDALEVERAGWTVILLGVAFAVFSALMFLLFPRALISLYLDVKNPDAVAIIAYGAPLLAIAGAFQIVDTLQVLGAGLLRALKDTRVPMLIALFSYWVVGIPSAYVLGFVLDYGGRGVWGGLALGLAFAAVLMNQRYFRRDRLGLMHMHVGSE